MNVLVLTGAGISAESSIPTFRGPDGLWNGLRPEELATPEAFAQTPGVVHDFYNQRRRQLLNPAVKPNAAHVALADFEKRHTGSFLLVTQNVDDLHQRAGSKQIIAMHGELLKSRCLESGEVFDCRNDLSVDSPHPEGRSGLGPLRPHIVWFGEVPFGLDAISEAASKADLFLAIGTSGMVYPAAGIVQMTPAACCRKVEINTTDTPTSPQFNESLRGPASEIVPAFLETLIA